MKKRRPIDVFESAKDPAKEHAYVKFRGEEPIDITSGNNSEYSTSTNRGRISQLGGDTRPYSHIHEHPEGDEKNVPYAIPSDADIKNFFMWPEKNKVIIHKNARSGREMGRTILRKTRNTESALNRLIELNSKKYGSTSPPGFKSIKPSYSNVAEQEAREMMETNLSYGGFVELMNRLGLKYRFVPARGYKLSEEELKYVPVDSPLVSKVIGIIGIVSFIFSMVLLSSNLTGLIIAVNILKTDYFGIIFFIIGLMMSIIYFKNKK